jgi:transposase-like protein
MIDYETFCKIKHYHEQAHLRISQIARTLGLHPRTVAHWVSASQYRRRQSGRAPANWIHSNRENRALIGNPSL